MAAVSMEPVVVETLDSHGRVRASTTIVLDATRRRFTLGRAVTADVVLSDPHVAAEHAVVELTPEGVLRVTDLGSVNGVVVAGRRHHGARDLTLTDGLVQIGRSRLRLRSRHEPLPAERPDHGLRSDLTRNAGWIAAWSALVCALMVIYGAWIEAPRDAPTVFASALTLAFAGAGAWVSVWALLSRLLHGEWRWTLHAATLFAVSAAASLVGLGTDLAWFALALPPAPWRALALGATTLALLLYAHVSNVAATRRALAPLLAAALPLAIFATVAWVQARSQARNPNHIAEPSALFPPSLQLRRGESPQAFFADVAALRAEADRLRRATPADEAEDAAPD